MTDSEVETGGQVEEVKPLAQMKRAEMVAKLREMGEEETAAQMEEKGSALEGLFGGPRKPYLYRTHQIGYFPLRQAGDPSVLAIEAIGMVEPDSSLLNGRIDIHLDRLHVQEYPGSLFGGGDHQVLVNFQGINQLPEAKETVGFAQKYDAADGDLVGALGYPVFIGLNVGNTGVAFRVETVNVKNSQDEAFLSLLDSQPFTSGLSLLSTAQPALQPLTELTVGMARMLAGRSKNVKVQEMYLGLDTTQSAAGAALAEGNFIVAQVPSPAAVDWQEWVFDGQKGAVVRKEDGQEGLPYNYLIFRVTKHRGS